MSFSHSKSKKIYTQTENAGSILLLSAWVQKRVDRQRGRKQIVLAMCKSSGKRKRRHMEYTVRVCYPNRLIVKMVLTKVELKWDCARWYNSYFYIISLLLLRLFSAELSIFVRIKRSGKSSLGVLKPWVLHWNRFFGLILSALSAI